MHPQANAPGCPTGMTSCIVAIFHPRRSGLAHERVAERAGERSKAALLPKHDLR